MNSASTGLGGQNWSPLLLATTAILFSSSSAEPPSLTWLPNKPVLMQTAETGRRADKALPASTATAEAMMPNDESARRAVVRLREIAANHGSGLDPKAVNAARNFLELAAYLGTAIPSIAVSDDGELMIYGRRLEAYVDIGFASNGTYSYYAISADGRESLGDALYPSAGLPSELQQALQDLAAI
jgi:hypothetical protein